jgi:hypothetical protein
LKRKADKRKTVLRRCAAVPQRRIPDKCGRELRNEKQGKKKQRKCVKYTKEHRIENERE